VRSLMGLGERILARERQVGTGPQMHEVQDASAYICVQRQDAV
jgi:hypothetical protein